MPELILKQSKNVFTVKYLKLKLRLLNDHFLWEGGWSAPVKTAFIIFVHYRIIFMMFSIYFHVCSNYLGKCLNYLWSSD